MATSGPSAADAGGRPGRSRRWRGRALAVSLVALLGLVPAAPGEATQQPSPRRHVVTIGAILDLRAGWTSLGQASRVTLHLAVVDANASLRRSGSPLRLRLRVTDARGEPALARRQLRRLARAGVHVVIGPESSSEVAAVRRTANRLGVVVISQGSTAHSLAIAGDNVLRFLPDDLREGEAVVALLRHDGIDAIVPVWRDDPGNTGLARSVREAFIAAGGTVSTGVPYATTTTSFAGVAASISQQAAALEAAGAKKVGVYLAGFDEVVGLFHAAQAQPALRTPWFGSDGVALSTALVDDQAAAAFASSVGYPNPTVGLTDALLRNDHRLIVRAHRRLGRDPDALSLTAYDALRIAVTAMEHTHARRGPALRAAIVAAADAHFGATGRMTLNRAGDRAYGTYDFWSVCHTGSGFGWLRTYQYVSHRAGSGRIVRRASCQG